MARTIILPKEIPNKLVMAANKVRQESNGVILYSQQGDLYLAEAYFLTGIGSEGEVQPDPIREKAVFEFLKKHPKYKYIKFHTHTQGTIEKHGKKYAREFSEGDIAGIKEQLEWNPEYMAMLVTPEVVLLSGRDNPELKVVEHSEVYEQRHETIEQLLKGYAERLGEKQENRKSDMKIK